ncbi:hypothetical protein LB565_09840 [Mesorhizobium sp. CA14]|nr:hypothetical protein [Mesorhizobium sp. CA14]MBZ9848282.1 hypothetical protein [Mesorhizobium sp. CA14]
MRRIIALVVILVIVAVAVWVWADHTGRRRNGGAQQPSPHAIDQNG